MSVRIFAPAKVNLTLEVGRPLADGYHPLQSAVVFASEGDWIEAEVQPDAPIHIRGPFGDALAREIDFETDPISKAFRALERDKCAAVILEKNLPLSSGIGGGSSDAAATLKALNLIWELGLAEAELMRIGREIGADVPVCVAARSSWMSGVGEVVEAMETPVLHAVLLNPLKPLSTPRVFREFDRMQLGENFTVRSPPVWRTLEEAVEGVEGIGNDLEAPAVALMPELAAILGSLRADPRSLCASLSGSGATCFAITHTGDDARAMAKDLTARNNEWWVRAATLGA